MATTINAGNATTGAAISADTTGILALQSGSTPTTAVTIDASQNVGIGVTSPAAKLDISTTAAYGGIKANGDGGASISFYQPLSNASARNYRIVSNYEAWGTLDFQRSLDNTTAPTTTQLTINNSGVLVLKGGTISSSGVGVAFPATQVASSDANILDDYEEGTWTPTFTSWGGTFTTVATYAKIGRVVYFNVTVTQVSGTVTSTANSSSFTLPFTVSVEGVFSGSTSAISSNGQGVAYSGTTAYSPTMSIAAGKGYMTGFYFTST